MPKVSVIIPCYNHGQYVDEAVNSVLAQTFQDFEIIIVNDGSTDAFTNEILKNYNKPKTKVIHTINQGLSAARNNGIRESHGEYILPLDADDKIQPTFLEKTINIISADNNIKAVSSYVEFFGELSGKGNPKGGEIENFLHYNNTIATSLYGKNEWIKLNGYNEKMKSGYEDWDFWLRLLKNGGKIHIIQEYLFCYRKHKSSMLTDTATKHIQVYSYLIENNISIFKENAKSLILFKEQLILNQTKEIERLNNMIFNLDIQKNKIYGSYSYKLGNFLLKPFTLLKKILHKNK